MPNIDWLTKDMIFFLVLGTAIVYAVISFSMHWQLQRTSRENQNLRRHLRKMKSRKKKVRRVAPQSKKPTQGARRKIAAKPVTGFDRSLQRADISYKIENSDRKSTPEKYRLFLSLANQGVNAAEAAEALRIMGISPVEARQLMKLNSLSRDALQGGAG
jgi:biopolymer transport protein ExbB/TolQ